MNTWQLAAVYANKLLSYMLYNFQRLTAEKWTNRVWIIVAMKTVTVLSY